MIVYFDFKSQFRLTCNDNWQVTVNDATRRLLSEKDRQIDLLREREHVLSRECSKYRDTIQQLTDPETNDYDPLLKTQVRSTRIERA